MSDAGDPRPLTGESLSVDLVDTTWTDDAGPHDLLDDPVLTRAWLARWGLADGCGPHTVTHLREARAAIRGLLEQPDDAGARDAFAAILARGRLRLTLEDGVPGDQVEAPPGWRASWVAARDLLDRLAERPERLKRCANPDCVLWFEDTTRSGTRRWCSMTGGCGSRLKARRYQNRIATTDAS